VETGGQADRLQALGCDTGQGRYFGSPAPAEEITARLRRRDRSTTSAAG
jgi:EAL domain-containing protein (putative c-di-GMP-specific phosphodiesterase class I)